MDAEVTLIDREIYSFFMMLGDVGGLSGILITFGSLLTGVINFQNAENYVVQSLFLGSTEKSQTNTVYGGGSS